MRYLTTVLLLSACATPAPVEDHYCDGRRDDSKEAGDPFADELKRAKASFAAETLKAFWEIAADFESAPAAGSIADRLAMLRKKMEVHAADVSNVLTCGYRARIWSEARVTTSNAQGTLRRTDRDLDVAIDGEGFFRVILPDGTRAYLRAGEFDIDAEGRIVTRGGHPLDPAITIPENIARVLIDQTGLVLGFDPHNPSTLQQIGQIMIMRFPNPEAMEPVGDRLYGPGPDAGHEIEGSPATGHGFGCIRQAFLEESNVEVEKAAMELRRTIGLHRLLRELLREMGK